MVIFLKIFNSVTFVKFKFPLKKERTAPPLKRREEKSSTSPEEKAAPLSQHGENGKAPPPKQERRASPPTHTPSTPLHSTPHDSTPHDTTPRDTPTPHRSTPQHPPVKFVQWIQWYGQQYVYDLSQFTWILFWENVKYNKIELENLTNHILCVLDCVCWEEAEK